MGGIDCDTLRDAVERGLSVRAIAEELGRSEGSVRYWLARHGLRTQFQATHALTPEERPRELERHCRRHGLSRHVRAGRAGHYRCAACRAEAVAERRREVKRILVGEAGGRCALCGYDRYAGALQFHHLDPRNKVFAIGLRGLTRGLDAAREEARKCVLLCANCHAEVEAGAATIGGRAAAVGGNSIGRMLGC